MTVYGLTPQGLVIKTIEVIRAETEAALQLAFGSSVPLGDKTLLGEVNAIYSEREALLWELLEQIYSSDDPDASTGKSLVSVSAITGTLPLVASPSTLNETLTGDPATLVTAGNRVAVASTLKEFTTSADATIAALAAWAQNTAYALGDRRTANARAYQCVLAGTSANFGGGPATTAPSIVDGKRAFLAVSGLTTHVNDTIEVTQGGLAGNAFTLALVQNAGVTNAGVLSNIGSAWTFTFKGNTTTVANFEAQITASGILDVKVAGTGANLLQTTVDEFTATAFGGATEVDWQYLGEGTGAVDVAAASADKGAIVAAIGDLSVIKTPVFGWKTATNLAAAAPGQTTETDEQFRLRREAELATAGSTPADALRADLLEVTGVTTVTVFMNLTDVTDANSIPPHGVECVVQGGADQAVYDQLRLSVAAGIVTYGTSIGSSTDSQGVVHTMKFTRPTAVPIWVDVTLKFNPALPSAGGYPVDGDAEVAAAIVAYGNGLPVGQDVVATALGAQAFKVPGVLDVPRSGSLGGTLIKISSGPTSDATIVITPFQLATYTVGHVTVHSSAGSV